MTQKVQIKNATLYQGDCREILASLPAASAEIAVTSLPYNPKRRFKAHQRRKFIMGRFAQNDNCHYCGIKMVINDPAQHAHNEVTLEHKTPIVKGADGRDKKNIVLACFTCNKLKGEKTEEEYLGSKKFRSRVNHVKGTKGLEGGNG